MVESDFCAFKKADGAYPSHKKLDKLSDMSSYHVRIYFMKHRIRPHIKYPEYFSRGKALIAITYQWILTFSEMEEYFS